MLGPIKVFCRFMNNINISQKTSSYIGPKCGLTGQTHSGQSILSVVCRAAGKCGEQEEIPQIHTYSLSVSLFDSNDDDACSHKICAVIFNFANHKNLWLFVINICELADWTERSTSFSTSVAARISYLGLLLLLLLLSSSSTFSRPAYGWYRWFFGGFCAGLAWPA